MSEKTSLKSQLSPLLEAALKSVLGADPSFAVDSCYEIPKEEKFGDLSSHVVFRAAKEFKKNPKLLADAFLKAFEPLLNKSTLAKRISKVVVEGPGFLNFYYSPEELAKVLTKIHHSPQSYGKSQLPKKNILLEFVSANPTGPLTVAHGRQAALGDSLTKILRFVGHSVQTEYYNND